MSARDFKGNRFDGFGGFDSYDKEQLKGLSYLQSIFLVHRRGMQTIHHLNGMFQSIQPGGVKNLKFLFAGIPEMDSQMICDMSRCSGELIDGVAFCYLVYFINTILEALLKIATAFDTTGVAGGLFALLGNAISATVTIVLMAAIYGGFIYIFSTFYDRWYTVFTVAFLGGQFAMTAINMVSAVIKTVILVGSLSLEQGIFALLAAMIDAVFAFGLLVYRSHQFTVVTNHASF